MRHQTKLSLVQMIVCRLLGAKPFSEPALAYCLMNPKEHISRKVEFKIEQFSLKEIVWNCRQETCGHGPLTR